jgi:hypothetical protein
MGRSIGEQLFICHLYDYLSREVSPTSHALSEGFAHLLYQIYQKVQVPEDVTPVMDRGLHFLLISQRDRNEDRIDSHLLSAIGLDKTPIDRVAVDLLKFESDNTTVRTDLPDSVAVLSMCVECAGIIVSRRSNVSSTCSNACRTAGSRRDRLRDPKRKSTVKGQTQIGQETLRQVSLQLAELLRDRSLQTLERMESCPAELKTVKGAVTTKALRRRTHYAIEKTTEPGTDQPRMGYSIKWGGDYLPVFRNTVQEPNDAAKKIIEQLKSLLRESPTLYLGDIGDEKRTQLEELCPGHPYTKQYQEAEREDVRRRRLTAAEEAFHWKREGADAFKFKMKGISGRTKTTELDRLEMMEKSEEVVADRRERLEEVKKRGTVVKLVHAPILVIHDSDLEDDLFVLDEESDEYNELLDQALGDGRASFETEHYPEVTTQDIERHLHDLHEDQDNDDRAEQMKLDELDSK